MKRISLLTAVGLVLMCQTAPAPLSGNFPRLDALIERAEFVVIARIIKPLEPARGSGGVFEIQLLKVLKGNVKEGQRSSAYLRELFFSLGPHNLTSLTREFLEGQSYLLFLDPNTGQVSRGGKAVPADFVNENCAGDAVWIAGHFDLESLKGKSVRESVVALLHHTATQHLEFAAAVGMMIESRAGNGYTQKLTQMLWFDSNAEEAANFYLSILMGSRKDPNLRRYRDVVPGSGEVAGVKLWIEGQDLLLLNGGAKFKSTPTNMLTLSCDVQEEIDYYWEKLSAGGEKSKGGWVKDKFGVWWHVVPSDLELMLGKDPAKAERVMNAMMQMDKIDSAALSRASLGK